MQVLSDELEQPFRKRTATMSQDERMTKLIIKIQRQWRRHMCKKELKKRIKKMKAKSQISKQLLTSERTYCQNLSFVIQNIIIPSKSIIDDQQIHQLLFANLQEIYSMHQNFLKELEILMKDYSHHKTQLSKVIYKQLFGKQNFKQNYSNYCANYRKSNQMTKLLFINNAGFKSLLKKVQMNQSTALQSQLIKPMQRLCKYQLLLNNYFKNMEADHLDYIQLQKTISYVQNLVKETNQQVQQFLMDQKFRDLNYQFQDVFKKNPNTNRKLLFSIQDISLIDLIKDESSNYKQLNLFNDSILLVPVTTGKTIFSPLGIFRDLPNLKYFKNLVQLLHSDKYLTIQFKKQKQKQLFIQALKKSDIDKNKKDFIQVSILGTQMRTSLFKNYTVYIVQIKFQNQIVRKIYPRFKDMLKVQQIIDQKKIKLNLPSLVRQNTFVTTKSKTIQKRKLIIQQFLQKILNCKECYQAVSLFKVLNLTIQQNSKKTQSQIIINLPSGQTLNIMIDVNNSNIQDLKQIISQVLGLTYSSQFQIYQTKNKTTRLMDNQEPVLQILQNQSGFSFNPFKQCTSYVYTRHYYMDAEDQFILYKNDFMRAQLQLSVIKSQVLKYRLEEQLMITFLCLFAIYTSVPVNDDAKLTTFIKDICKKQYRVSKNDFRTYYRQVQKKVESEEDQLVTLPFLIIKIMSNSHLYRCRQFQVTVHPKSFKAIKGYIPGLEEKIILGIKNSHALLLTIEDKHIVQSFGMQLIQVAQIHPTSIILQISNVGPALRLDTQNAFQISKLFQIYQTKI